ncbi:hypothetical protein DCAR_0207620 [Daucus carota subsp. sativus]|uniref:Uncharacterized protein n=1 Tax=Daucus carota subsp. sativus TaxID=79200 RepID=A0AAF0WEC9_DAUCS|nr:hypothetical protein DCAR_0207620 [Daucus carota subsp. sativus]
MSCMDLSSNFVNHELNISYYIIYEAGVVLFSGSSIYKVGIIRASPREQNP